MIKYVCAILIFVAFMAAMAFYVGETSQLSLISISPHNSLDFEGQFSWRFVIVVLSVMMIMTILAWALVHWLMLVPTRLRLDADKHRRLRSFIHMQTALSAAAKGEQGLTRRHIRRIRSLVKLTELATIINAYAAHESGDWDEATSAYRHLLEVKSTHMLGQRGLCRLYTDKQDYQALILQTGTAYEQHKHAQWACTPLLTAHIALRQWSGAAHILQLAAQRKHMDKLTAQRRRAIALAAEADRLFKDGQISQACAIASDALNVQPDFLPAIILAARLLKLNGKGRKAFALLERAWGAEPQPVIALTARALFATPNQKGRDKGLAERRQNGFKALIKMHPTHPESLILMAEVAFEQGNMEAALTSIDDILADKAIPAAARLWQLKLNIEIKLGLIEEALASAQQALDASPELLWPELNVVEMAYRGADILQFSQADWERLMEMPFEVSSLRKMPSIMRTPEFTPKMENKTTSKEHDKPPVAIEEIEVDAPQGFGQPAQRAGSESDNELEKPKVNTEMEVAARRLL